MGDKSVVGPLLLGAAVTGATGLCLYLFLKQEELSREKDILERRKEHLDVWISNENLGVVLGRQGSNIREIQSRTNTSIWLTEDPTNNRSKFTITGYYEDVQFAEILINQTISSQPRIESCVLSIPNHAVHSVLGKNEENVRNLELKSRCRILVEKGSGDGQVKLTLRGTKDQIETGKEFVTRKLQENEYILNKINNKNNTKRLGYDQPLFLKYDDDEVDDIQKVSTVSQEELRCSGSDHLVQVYVSCVGSPWSFWVQNVGPSSVQLDKLTQDITQYYSSTDNQLFHQLESVAVGDIVVAQFSVDLNYYRCKVVEFTVDEYDPSKSTVDLDFVDFGDTEMKPISEVYEIKTEFLKLSFQAIPCKLAHVRPVEDGEWPEESIAEFEKLTHCALWKPILAKILQSSTVSGLDVSLVELYKSSQSGDRSVGDELVKQGLARFAR